MPTPMTVAPLLAAAALALATPTRGLATTVRECDFLTLHRNAHTIVYGRCLARRELARDGAIPYTEYVFEVLRAPKGCRDERGALRKRIVFRHVGSRRGYRRADGTTATPLRLGVPEYAVGSEAVLFLTAPSKLGLCAPVGLGQGHFKVRRRGNVRSVHNVRRNHGLFRRLRAETLTGPTRATFERARSAGSAIRLDDFLVLCREVGK